MGECGDFRWEITTTRTRTLVVASFTRPEKKVDHPQDERCLWLTTTAMKRVDPSSKPCETHGDWKLIGKKKGYLWDDPFN